MAECVTLYHECFHTVWVYLPESLLHGECVTLYRECFHTVWVYLPESLLHGGVCYTVSRVFSHCLGVST